MDSRNFGFFFFQAEDGIRDVAVTGVQTCALPISRQPPPAVVLIDVQCKTTAGGGCRENGYTEHVYSFAAIDVAERSPDQQQSSQQESVGFDHPLYVEHCCIEIRLKSGQRDINYRAVDKG